MYNEIEGLQQGRLKKVNEINKLYNIYDGKQEWKVDSGLDYKPTIKVTNYIKKLVDKKARFMFGKEPYFNIQGEGEQVDEKEDLLVKILTENKWHSKLLKAKKDCSIGGSVALRLWADKDEGVKLIFSPAQEYEAIYNLEDVDLLEKVSFIYALNDEMDKGKQRIKKQVWELINGKCIVNEGIYDGYGKKLETFFQDYDNGLDFIPVIIIRNGGLTGDTKGYSDVMELWSNQDAYNKLTSDDQDALKFQMFGQTVLTDASDETLDAMTIAPGALVDLQTTLSAVSQGKQAQYGRLESQFSYGDKYTDTIDRIKNDMHSLMDIPNTSLEQLKGLMASGKSMKALYWDLIATCDEEWSEWGPALEQMVSYIFKIVEIYDCYKEDKGRSLAKLETTLTIERYYPIQEDEIEMRKADLSEVIAQVRSKESYIKKWSEVEDVDSEVQKIATEIQMTDNYSDDFGMADDNVDDTVNVPDIEGVLLNGAQISSLIRIIESVINQIIDYETAVKIVMKAFNFDDKTARDLLGKPPTASELEEKQDILEEM